MIYQSYIKTPLGGMTAISNKSSLMQLFFTNNDERNPLYSKTDLTLALQKEVDDYFSGVSWEFSIPLSLSGTDFQNQVWHSLLSIEYGRTISYKEQAISIGDQKKARAVAAANAANPILIIIPCHRVIRANGNISGYSAGQHIKQFLLDHELHNPISCS